MADKLAGIDVHKRVLMVAVASRECPEARLAEGRFGTGASEMERLRVWLSEQGVRVVVMESTAQYWKPVWLALEGHVELALAQAHSNRAPHGRKSDFRDAHRLVRRYMANELYLSFIPDAEQRAWRTMTRTKVQIIRDRVRVQNQMESLLEEMRIKLSSVISDLLGKSGRRILRALAEGEVDPAQLASLGDDRLRCSQKELVDALTGSSTAIQRKLLGFQLDHVELLDGQIAKIDGMLAEAFQAHQDAVVRLAEVPGFGPDSTPQVIAEVGVRAQAFASAGDLASWAGVCPGENESAEENHSTRSPKGNRYLRRILTQAAQAAVKTRGSHWEAVFQRLTRVQKLDYPAAIWAVANRLCRVVWKILHDGVRYVERGAAVNPRTQTQRIKRMIRQLRNLGYQIVLPSPAPAAPRG